MLQIEKLPAEEDGAGAVDEEGQASGGGTLFAHSKLPSAIPLHTSVSETYWPFNSYVVAVGPGTSTTGPPPQSEFAWRDWRGGGDAYGPALRRENLANGKADPFNVFRGPSGSNRLDSFDADSEKASDSQRP